MAMNAIEQFFPPEALPAARAELAARIAAIEAAHGADAFLMPRADAALHEAGHCVIGALWGRKIRLCRVIPKTIGDRAQWGGRTLARPDGYLLDRESNPAADSCWACFIAAGPLAEHLFSKRPRAGSGLDEMILVKHAAESIACKIGRDARATSTLILAKTIEKLKRHEGALRAIAAQLMDRNLVAQKQIDGIFDRHAVAPDQGFIEHGVLDA
jgi:hypothetical protein